MFLHAASLFSLELFFEDLNVFIFLQGNFLYCFSLFIWMISFRGQEYELFFSNNLPPLVALNYADELFFEHFERLCGRRYRILSVIRGGWQEKFGLADDIEQLRVHFAGKRSDASWVTALLREYDEKSAAARDFLDRKPEVSVCSVQELVDWLHAARELFAPLDAMSNMLHLFSSLVGPDFLLVLRAYSDDNDVVNQNFIFFTQPIRESRLAKIIVPSLEDHFKLSAKDVAFSELLRIGAFVKDDVSDLLEQRGVVLNDVFEKIALSLGCSVDDVQYLQLQELEHFLMDATAVAALVRDRRRLTVLCYPEQKLEVFEGKGAEDFLKEGYFRECSVQVASVLRGQTGSLGKVKAPVIVARTSAEAMEKMVDGAILVAPYTAVEYLPVMRRAAAIVTETGGITAHAAIVSRELRIPCVIGVKDATRLLRDGQVVLVNADEGKVVLD